VFVRHGIAQHNLLDENGNPASLNDPNLFDPTLTLEGKKQALDTGERLRIWWHTTQVGEQVELVISSPLTRCLQTATLAFLPGDQYAKEHLEPTFACMDLVREAYGMSYPDRRRPKSLLVSSWPNIHFDPSMSERDEAWQLVERESVQDVVSRVNGFLEWLVLRPETNIVVVSSGVWIECCFYAHFPMVLANGDRVRNGDSFAADCVSYHGVFQSLQEVRRIV
jgi:broad specificity phosphatase PhoE